MKRALAVLFVVISFNIQASLVDDIKTYIRSPLEELLGVETTEKILGPRSNKIQLPKIPKINEDAKNTANMGARARNEVKYKKEQETRYNYTFIREVFRATRRLEAGEKDVLKWLNVLSQSGSREGVYRALVLDGTYLGLENYEYFASSKTVEFTMEYLDRFLDKSINKESLEKANFYTIKRDITEKTLEVIDELFKKKGDDIYNWYAVFSAQMAKDYPKAMNNETRRVKSANKHKLWAKSVPDQYLKSEVIMKLHNIYNLLQG